MEIFLLALALVILSVLLVILLETKKALERLTKESSELRNNLKMLSSQIAKPGGSPEPSKTQPDQPIEKPKDTLSHLPAVETMQERRPTAPIPVLSANSSIETQRTSQNIAHKPSKHQAEFSWYERWLHENPDIEKFIGENLINKIGIAVLVLGIAFFVKYAIDQDWVNKVGRVCIGLLCGAILTGLAHRVRKNYHSFSSVLVGGGLSVFYFTIAFAFHQYHLLNQVAAFAIMVIMTAFAVALALLYSRIELGIIATIGGFITPFLVSTGKADYVSLFTYIAILNTGLIVLAYFKKWQVVNLIAFLFTQIIYLGWIFNGAGQADFPYMGTLTFGTVFYGMFVLMNIIHQVAKDDKLKSFDFLILLSVNLFYYASGLYLLQESGNEIYKGLFTALLGIFNMILAFSFFKKSKADKNFIYLLIGITITFISLTAPVQLHGHYITLFWSAELVVLFWLYQKSFLTLVKIASLVVTCLMLVSLASDWNNIYDSDVIIPVLFNKGFVTGITAAVALLIYYFLMRKEADTYFLKSLTNNSVRRLYFIVSVILFFLAGALEINYQFTTRTPGSGYHFVYLQLFVVAFTSLLFAVLQRKHFKQAEERILALPLLAFVLYCLNLRNAYNSELYGLSNPRLAGLYSANWVSFALSLYLGFASVNYIRKNKNQLNKGMTTYSWIISISAITLLSFEIFHLVLWIGYSGPSSVEKIETVYSKAGLTILWAISSFIIMWLGMYYRFKPLRIVALTVFGITLVKLFGYDIQNIAPAGKIVAFILLGALLLIISFMYQRLKKIIFDDPNHSE